MVVAVVGGGQSGVQLCMALRKEKYEGAIRLYCEEPERPYHRPPLSKTFVTGKTPEDKLPMRPESFYATSGVEVRLAEPVTSIDSSGKTVSTAKATEPFEHLVLATGARPRALPLPGAQLQGVFMLRDVSHARGIRDQLPQSTDIVIIGGGFIGLEFAAAARSMGKEVTVFDTADRVMARAVAPDISAWFAKTHRSAGIDIRLEQGINGIAGENGRVCGVECADGSVVAAQLVVIGIGVAPNTEIAEAAAIACDNGVLVDEYCETSIPGVYASGDCASHPNPFAGGARVRLESIQNATDQARTIARCIAGERQPYHSVPWFWSEQGEHKLQMTGLSANADQYVIRGDVEAGAFSVLHYSGDILQAVDTVNVPKDHMLARKLIANGVSPTHQQAADPLFDLWELLA